MKQFIYLFFFLLIGNSAFAQGTIRGVLVDEETQEPLIGGVVTIEGTSIGNVTDIDGAYTLTVPAGVYTVVHTYIGYETKNISDVEVVDGEVVAMGNIGLGVGGDASTIEEVVVVSYPHKDDDEGLLNFQRNSTKILDAVSAEAISKSGDSDVAAVVKRVPGVTVESGKYVYVRGLGDRYSKSVLNGMELPGLDPERNTVQMDIFPANIIDNVIVYKTFSPDLSGDFTGGMVNVETKDFPQEKLFSVSLGTGYNSITTFNDNYIGTDFTAGDMLGFGESSRRLPFAKTLNPNKAPRQEVIDATEGLNKTTAVTRGADNFLNSNFNITYGNQYEVGKNKLGFTSALTLKNDYAYQGNWERNDLAYADNEVLSNQSQYRTGAVGKQEGLLNAIINGDYKFDSGKVGVKLMHTRTGEGFTSLRTKNDQANDQDFDENIIDYFQRTISNAVIESEFYLGENQDIILEGALAGTYSSIQNPERTSVQMFIDPDGSYTFASNSSFTKEWRNLEENNLNGKLDLELPFMKSRDHKSTVKFGYAGNYKLRGFEPIQVKVAPSNPFSPSLVKIPDNNLDYILEHVATTTQDGYIINDVKVDLENKYYADMYVNSGYAMTDYQVNEKLKFIGGARVEYAIMDFAGYENNVRRAVQTLNSVQLLPSANFVYEMKDYMNFRGSYNRTLARPSFKEKSRSNIFDAIQNQFFIGNIDLVETTVDNYDVRWEYYFDRREMVSISPFYKRFKDPIELSFINNSQVQPINKNEARVLGIEGEIRKDFGFINPAWERVSFNGNLSLVQSRIDLTENEKLKYGTDVPEYRDFVGQAPISINAGISYDNPENGWGSAIGYNVKGRTLNIVGFTTTNYDVYEDPFNNLDWKVSKKLGNEQKSTLSLNVRNILGDNIDYYYAFQGKRLGSFQSYDVGRNFSLGYTMNF